MSISRRSFLQAGAMAAFAAGTTRGALAKLGDKMGQASSKGASPQPIPYAARLDPIYYLKQSSFAPYVNTPFRVRNADSKQTTTLALVAVADLRSSQTKQNEDAYSLLFTGARTKALAQDIYSFKHAALGEFSLLLVRTYSRDESRAYYEAIIDRLPA